MTPYDPSSLINSRFEGIDRRFEQVEGDIDAQRTEFETFKTSDALLAQTVAQMTESFKAMRTALYATAGTILAAAILLIILGKHP